MNYLAHAFLSNNDKNLLVGNFIADHLRGNDFKAYSSQVIEGIYLHRHIDAFTDAHPLFKSSKRFFYEGFEKYSGVLVDIYFDHLLAKNFGNYAQVPLKEFSHKVYLVYEEAKKDLPDSSSRFLEYVLKNDIYTGYATIEGIQHVLTHLSHRINHLHVRLDQSVPLFKKHEQQMQENFTAFFADAMKQFLPKG